MFLEAVWGDMKFDKVLKKTLDNGLTTLVASQRTIPKVSTQLWYNVGSKDEKSGQRGMAHLIEHMLFKGTDRLSECDISMITHKLSGYCNAFTSHDYTGYLFDFPSQNWQESLSIMADCMRNCLFKEAFLASELKAVIQELKLYKDNYAASLAEHLVTGIFPDHPYHHPIIGYKQDLWSLKRDELVAFYQRHYIPNNATLVVVGDVDADNVFRLAEKHFGAIHSDRDYAKERFYHSPDLRNYRVTIYRDIKQPIVMSAWVIPGLCEGKSYLIDLALWIIGMGKGSRLYRKLVDELQLVTELDVFQYDLFDYGLFFIYFQPKKLSDMERINEVIWGELARICEEDISEREISRAVRKADMAYLGIMGDNQNRAYEIAKYFLATGDEQFLPNYAEYAYENIVPDVKRFVADYLRPDVMHMGSVLPLKESERHYWQKLQEISDQEDARVLDRKVRKVEVDEGECVYSVPVQPPVVFDYPSASTVYLSNDLKVLYYDNAWLPKIDLVGDFKAKYYYDPHDRQGLGAFVAAMLEEGTKHYSAAEFTDTLESYGMTFYGYAGAIGLRLLSADLPKGLELLVEVLTDASFDQQPLEKVREQMLAEIDQYWDNPIQFVNQIVRENLYAGHPYSKNPLGTRETVRAITHDDLVDHYRTFLSPKAARFAVVGGLERYDVKETLEHMLYGWRGDSVADMNFPPLKEVTPREINYPIMRDQVVLCYGGLSTTRASSDYDKLLLFDQIFTGGVLGSMHSRLFDLRERSGLFYTVGGSLVRDVGRQPGMITVRTVVSNDRLAEAEKEIENVINTAVDSVTPDEFDEAKRAIINSLVDNFSSNYRIAATMLFQDEYELSDDYFSKRAKQLASITIDEMQCVVKKYLRTDKMIKVRVGRV